MSIEEVNDIITAVSKLDIEKMDVQDQLLYLYAGLQYAETVKPLVIKYLDKLPEKTNFLLKL